MVAAPPALGRIRAAREAIRSSSVRTPLLQLNVLDAPASIHLKLENLQPIGSFKIRAAAYATASIPRDELDLGVITASAGNMGQAVAWEARRLGIPCTVVVPDSAPQRKLDAMRQLDARIIPVTFDEWWATLADRAYAGIDGKFIHPFDDDDVIAADGTIGLEIVEDLPDVEVILVPWGGGGLSTGIAAAVRAVKPECRVFAVEVEGAAPLVSSLAAGRPVTIDYRPSFVDGIGSKTVFPNMLAMAQQLLDGSLTASLDEIAAALRLMAERNRVIAEGAGAVALAVALSGKAGKGHIACIVSGGNIDLPKLTKILGEH